MTLGTTTILILCPLVFLASFIDSIAGGGALISLTSFLAFGIPAPYALGTEKFTCVVGCSVSCVNYIKTKNYEMKTLLGAMVAALFGSWMGSTLTMAINSMVFSVIMLCVTPLIVILVLLGKKYDGHEKDMSVAASVAISTAIGLVIGFYDGFYGPGAGMFIQMGLIQIAGVNVKKACGNARMINWASGFAAAVNFLIAGNIIWAAAVPCTVCSIVGNSIGSRLAIKKDVKIVKPMMVCVVCLLFVKVLLDLLWVGNA